MMLAAHADDVFEVAVDGGIKSETIGSTLSAGATTFISGIWDFCASRRDRCGGTIAAGQVEDRRRLIGASISSHASCFGGPFRLRDR